MIPVPVGLQPTPYVRAVWQGRPYGAVKEIEAASVHDGKRAVFLIRWRDASEDRAEGDAFADAAAIALPVSGNPVLASMGSEQMPIHVLHWRAGVEGARSVLGMGIGASRPGPALAAESRGSWRDGVWSVAIARSLAAEDGVPPLVPGRPSRIGFAVWNGANQERGGIKAFSIDWKDLRIDP